MQITERIANEDAKSIRVLLYMALLSGGGGSLRGRLRCSRKLWRWLAVPVRKRAPEAVRGCLLFAFIFDTPANMNNLLPVFHAARNRGGNPAILEGDRVDIHSKDLGEMAHSVGVTGLISLTTVKERLAAVARARNQFAGLCAGFDSYAPRWASTVRCHRFAIVSELALFTAASHGLRRLYEAWEPSCVISTSDLWPFDHAVFVEARRHGIPSFVIQHGVAARFWWPFVADKLVVWGDSFQGELINFGTPVERLAVCGMPAADHLFARFQGNAVSRPCKTASSYVVLSDTQARGLYPDLYSNYGALFKALVAATPSVRWSIKLHPMEDESFYQELLDGRFPNFRILPKSTTLEEAVTQADIACTLWSTAGLEAMMMRRPLVVFDMDPMIHEHAWWPKRGGGTYVNTLEAMLDFIQRAAANRQFVADLVSRQNGFLSESFANPGRAAEAILDMVEKTVETRASSG